MSYFSITDSFKLYYIAFHSAQLSSVKYFIAIAAGKILRTVCARQMEKLWKLPLFNHSSLERISCLDILNPRFCHLTPQSRRHYQHLYCSICYSLRQQFGLSASFSINHELTLSLAAFPDYANMRTEECACPARLFCKQKPVLRDPAIDKAAQLCLLLVWLKLVDWETDSPAFYKHHLRQSVEMKIQPILAGLTPATRQFIDSYLLLIRANSTDFSTSAKMSGLLAQHVFQELSQNAAQSQQVISEISLLLGELITVADALLDLKTDIQNKQFNPIISATVKNHTTLEQEYACLKADYDLLVQKIKQVINSENLKLLNPLFAEILLQSLHNLAHTIQAANTVLFAASDSQRNKSRSDSWCECADGCCDCLDCCQCCGDNSSCCGGAGESGGSCCECGSCCDCGGCDCSC